MSSIVNQFKEFREFPNELKQNIKLFDVFEDNAYCVTNDDGKDDKVYRFGYEVFFLRYFKYNQSNDNKSYVFIQQLCDKRILSILNNFSAVQVCFLCFLQEIRQICYIPGVGILMVYWEEVLRVLNI